jgi:hypothetical protein
MNGKRNGIRKCSQKEESSLPQKKKSAKREYRSEKKSESPNFFFIKLWVDSGVLFNLLDCQKLQTNTIALIRLLLAE